MYQIVYQDSYTKINSKLPLRSESLLISDNSIFQLDFHEEVISLKNIALNGYGIINGKIIPYNNENYEVILYDKLTNELLLVTVPNKYGIFYFDRVNLNSDFFIILNNMNDSNKKYYAINDNKTFQYLYTDDLYVYKGTEKFVSYTLGIIEKDTAVVISDKGNIIFKSESKDNGIIEIDDVNLQKITDLYISYNNKYFKIDNSMIRGYINGSIDIFSCLESDFYIQCYQTQGNFIGEYEINNDGTYTIPNLDTNQFYDIHLVDRNKIMENQVHSMRKPTPY